MSYNLDHLFAKWPSERLIVPYENPFYPVVFIARWPHGAFQSHGAFVRFTEMYDSAMQGFIQGMPPHELAQYFEPHDGYDLSAQAIEISPSRQEDAVDWLKRSFPFVQIPWLREGDYVEIIAEDEGEFGSLTAYGNAGYLYVFVADRL